jgi:isopentenyl-diphosphate delta-isomerase
VSHPPIQIVNDNDEPVGQASMSEAQHKGLYHRIVRVMIENDKGEILLQKRSDKVRMPNQWDHSAAGHVDVGEDYLTAAKRELKEELGVSSVELKEIDAYFTDNKFEDMILKRFNRLYKATINYTPQDLQTDEVAEVKWMSLDELKQLIKKAPKSVTQGLQDVIKRYY